jgi:sulfur-oxidizing protein SoxY
MSLLQSTERREFLRSAFTIVGTLIVTPSHSSDWDQIAYNKTRIVDSIKSVGIDDFSNIIDGSDLIELNTPEIAENGAIVPITIQSQIPQTKRIFVFSEKNPQPLVSDYVFSTKVTPYVASRFKMSYSYYFNFLVLCYVFF